MLVLIVAGLHEPVMALIERFGSDGAAEFRQIGPIWLWVILYMERGS